MIVTGGRDSGDLQSAGRTSASRAEPPGGARSTVKAGYEYRTPLTVEAIAALERMSNGAAGAGAAGAERCVEVPVPQIGPPPAEQDRDVHGAETEAGPGQALAEAQVRIGRHGPAAEAALRAWRLDERSDADLLPAAYEGQLRKALENRSRGRTRVPNRRERDQPSR